MTMRERGYSNWELSADRANASRRELIAGGMDEAKMLRVVGLAVIGAVQQGRSSDPVNRRISIIVMNKRTEEAVTKQASGNIASDEDETRSKSGQNDAPPR